MSSARHIAILACASLGLVGVAGGCAATAYPVKVDTTSRPASREVQSYVLKNKGPAATGESLRHQEATEHIRTALSGKGLYEAPSPDRADMIVEMDYGLDAPRSKVEMVSVPVYAQVGGGVRYETVPVVDAKGNQGSRTMAVYEPPRSELVGYREMPRMVTVYEKYLKITARENGPMQEGRPPAELWSIHASAEDESKDLRKYLPMMASATVDFIGQEESSQTIVKVRADEPGVEFIRRGMSTGAAPARGAPVQTGGGDGPRGG